MRELPAAWQHWSLHACAGLTPQVGSHLESSNALAHLLCQQCSHTAQLILRKGPCACAHLQRWGFDRDTGCWSAYKAIKELSVCAPHAALLQRSQCRGAR